MINPQFPIEIAPDVYLVTSVQEFIICTHFQGRFELNEINQIIFIQS